MNQFLISTYQVVSVVLFLFISAVMLYHGLLRRLLAFSLGFFVVYGIGSYAFFGDVSVPFVASDTVRAVPYFLFFFGAFACVGYCLVSQLSWWQTLGVLSCFLFLLLAFVFVTGTATEVVLPLPGRGSIIRSLISLPYILFFVGSPLVLGYCLYEGFGFRQSVGLYLMYCFTLILLTIASTNYFGVPFGIYFELSEFTQAWIELGATIAVLVGLPAVLGFCLMNSWSFRESLGALFTFGTLATVVVVAVHLTIGFDFLVLGLGAR